MGRGGMGPGAGGSAATPLLAAAGRPLSSLSDSPYVNLPTRVLDLKRRHKLALERVNVHGRHLYVSDFYHTLVNCPWYRFYFLFVFFYICMYSCFALFYMTQPRDCISRVQSFWHALWFSVHTSATIGYGHQAPDPSCFPLQFGIMGQVLTSLLMQASLLGLVFARISNSSGRSATIRFSKALSMYRGEDGVYRLAFRVANLRQHQVLQPEVRMLLLRRQQAHPFSSGGWEFVYSELPAQHIGGGRLWLGVPSVIEHRVDAASAMHGMTEGDLAGTDLEIIVLLDGIDESTSRAIEARHSYGPADIRWRHHFDPCIQRRQSGRLGVDFSIFDSTTQLAEDEEEGQQQPQGDGAAEWTTPSSTAAEAGGSMLPAGAGGANGAALPGGLFVPSPHRSAFQSPAPPLAPPPV